MTDTHGMLGRLPERPESEAPRLKLARFLDRDALPPTPALVDWVSKVSGWGMLGNDSWSDCVFAAVGHMIEAATCYGQGATVKVSLADVLKGYSDVTGFDQQAGPPGRNPTDRGTVIQDALSHWRKTGIGDHKILAFARVDHRNLDEVTAALNLFGHLMVGVDFPSAGMAQFDHGQPWDVVANDGGSDGGHAVTLGFDASGGPLKAVSWGRAQPLTPAWWSRYVREAWVVIMPEWLDAVGHAPAGLDLYGLGEALSELTHGKTPNPFPQPAPVPTPPPSPTPAPTHDAVDDALATAVQPWLATPHRGDAAKVAAALKTYLTKRGLA